MDIENYWYHLHVIECNGAVQQHAIGPHTFAALRKHGLLYQRTRGWYELSELGQRALDGYRAQKRAG